MFDFDCPASPQVDAHGRNSAKSNRRIATSLLAWAEVLDALGWSVALRLPGTTPTLSGNARKWVAGQACEAVCWAAIDAHVSHADPANILISTPDVKVWLETETLPESDVAKRPCEILTKRESEICGWLRGGKTGPEIAIILGCAQRTVESHVARLYRKLGVRSRAQFHFQTHSATPRCPVRPASLPNSPPAISRPLSERWQETRRLNSMWNALASGLAEVAGLNLDPAGSGSHLSAKDASILVGLTSGQSRDEIAAKLQWRRDTLDRNLAAVRERLGLENNSLLLSLLATLRPATFSRTHAHHADRSAPPH